MNQITSPSTPASMAQIGEALKVLFNALPFQRGTDPQVATLAYVEALQGLSNEAIVEGIRKFLRGECEGVSVRHVPTPPELARIIRAAVIPSRVVQEKAEPAYRPDTAERGRMALKMALYRDALFTDRMADVHAAVEAGFDAAIALAQKWGVDVPAETWRAYEMPGAATDWDKARRRARLEMESNPPPFMRRAA